MSDIKEFEIKENVQDVVTGLVRHVEQIEKKRDVIADYVDAIRKGNANFLIQLRMTYEGLRGRHVPCPAIDVPSPYCDPLQFVMACLEHKVNSKWVDETIDSVKDWEKRHVGIDVLEFLRRIMKKYHMAFFERLSLFNNDKLADNVLINDMYKEFSKLFHAFDIEQRKKQMKRHAVDARNSLTEDHEFHPLDVQPRGACLPNLEEYPIFFKKIENGHEDTPEGRMIPAVSMLEHDPLVCVAYTSSQFLDIETKDDEIIITGRENFFGCSLVNKPVITLTINPKDAITCIKRITTLILI
jgi:hypothetical protein